MLMVNHLDGFGAHSSASAVAVAFGSADGSESDLTTYTFTGMTIGAADAARLVVAGFAWRQTADRTVSSVTIGGVSATEAVTSHSATGGASLWAAVVPTGTTADVVVTLSGGALRAACATWRLIGASGVAASATNSSTADPAALNVTIPANGAAVGVSWTVTSSTVTWTGLVEDFDLNPPGAVTAGNGSFSGASLASAAGGATTISADYSSASSTHAVSAAWGP